MTPRESRPGPPREWLERTNADLRSHTKRESGDHFMAVESLAGFLEEIRTYFGPLENERRARDVRRSSSGD